MIIVLIKFWESLDMLFGSFDCDCTQKYLFCLDPCDSEPQIVVEKCIAPTHFGEYLIAFLSWKSSFVIMHFLKTTNPYFTPYHLLWQKRHVHYMSFFYSQNLSIQHHIPIWGFCNAHILLSIFKIVFCFLFSNLTIYLQIQLSL